jgi:MFS family permease
MRATALSALRYPRFALFWTAQVISGFGDKITLFALAFATWQLTHSALSTALAVVISTVPYAIFGFFGGAIADAVGRRRSMVICDLIRMACVGLIPGLLLANVSLSVIYGLVFVAAICSAVFSPARLALLPDIVPQARLGAGNSLIYGTDRAIEVVGALLAGLLVGLLQESAFYVDAATFGISAVLLSRISLAEPASRAVSWRSLMADAAEGLRAIREIAVLRENTVLSLLAQLSLPVLNGLSPVLLFREYGLGPEQYGATEGAIALGAVATSVIAPTAGDVGKGRSILVGFAGFGLVLLAFAVSPPFGVALLLFFFVGVTNVLFYVPNMTLLQEHAPTALRGRVFGVRLALLNLTWLPVIIATGTLADTLPVPWLIGAAGAFTILVAVIGSAFRSVRDAD